MRLSILFLSLFICLGASAQSSNPITFDPDEILRQGEPVPQVLLVGAFHFAYYGLDAHVTKEGDKVNVLSTERQKEMRELVNYIARFKPTKIAVEGGRNTGYIIRRYEEYQADSTTQRANEIDQLAFPLMERFGLDTVYGTNTYGVVHDLLKFDSAAITPFMDSVYKDWDFRSTEVYSSRYDSLYDYEDKLANQHTLLEYFAYMNTDKSYDRGYGAYLTGDFKNGKYEGSDALAMHWYSRNLRIFRNIQDVIEPEDRVLVIYGAGHMTILKNLFACTPEYELVRFGDL